MKLIKFNQWITLTSNLGVIIGIVFLATELQQTNELMESERRFNRLQVVIDGNSSYFENPEIAESLLKKRNGIELTEREDFLLNFQMINILTAWQWTWLELGDTEEFPLEQYRQTFQESVFLDEFWEERKPLMLPEFAQFMEENIVQR